MPKTRHQRQSYEQVTQIVTQIIADWDPYQLLSTGSPADEFAHEVAAIAAQVARIGSSADAAHVVSCVFSSSFEPNEFTPESCAHVGKRLFEELLGRGLISK